MIKIKENFTLQVMCREQGENFHGEDCLLIAHYRISFQTVALVFVIAR